MIEVDGEQLSSGPELDLLSLYIKALHDKKVRVVLVHGGGAEVGALHGALGVARRTRDERPIVSESSLSLMIMAARGLVSTRLIAHLVRAGVPALGLSGVDLGLLKAEFLDRTRYHRAGRAPRVDSEALSALLDQGMVLALASLCLGPDGAPLRVGSATVAQAVAAALGADILEMVNDLPEAWAGEREGGTLSVRDLEVLIESSVISGAMVRVVEAVSAAVAAGIDTVRLGNLRALRREQATVITA